MAGALFAPGLRNPGGESGAFFALAQRDPYHRHGNAGMTLEPAQLVDVWPLGASLAAAAAQGLLAGRRRSALNEALHELRRPLQVLALLPSAAEARSPAIDGAVQMAATALERLECEINGREPGSRRDPVPVRGLLVAATRRWRARAALGGAEVGLGGCADGAATVVGDSGELAAALDNLIANAIEHGGSEIVVASRRAAAGIEMVVADSGRGSQPPPREGRTALVARIRGRRRHGHGLRVVRRIAAMHGGEFRLHRSEGGTEAILGLPLPSGPGR